MTPSRQRLCPNSVRVPMFGQAESGSRLLNHAEFALISLASCQIQVLEAEVRIGA